MCGADIHEADYTKKSMVAEVRFQLSNGHYDSGLIYGDGDAGMNISDVLSRSSGN